MERFTVTKSDAWVPSGAWQEIVNVVGPESGTVAPPPESDECEKLPSGDVSMHVTAPFEFQNIVVRAPSLTAGGTAHMSTCIGGLVGTAGGYCIELVAAVDDAILLGRWVNVTFVDPRLLSVTTGCPTL